MGAFANLKDDDSVQEAKDVIGGASKFGPVESDIYNTTINMIYTRTTDNGARYVCMTLKNEDGREIRVEDMLINSGNAKGNKNFYETKSGERRYHSGYTLINHLAMLTAGKHLSDLDTEEKVIKLWNYKSRSEEPTKVPVIAELLDKPISAAIFKKIEDKTAFDEASGNYLPTGETRTFNEVDKFFRASDKMTVSELKASADKAAFYATWKERWVGKVRDFSSKDAKATSAKAFGKAVAPTPEKSIFAA